VAGGSWAHVRIDACSESGHDALTQQRKGDDVRACPKCHGSGRVAEEDDYNGSRGFYREFYGVGYHRQSKPIHQDTCPECKGRGILRSSGSEGRPKTRAEEAIFQDETDDWTLSDWEWDARFEEFIRPYHEQAYREEPKPRAPDAIRASIIGKARALRRMTEANGATVHEAATASERLQHLMSKYGLSDDDLY
jgi:hypothetical protein